MAVWCDRRGCARSECDGVRAGALVRAALAHRRLSRLTGRRRRLLPPRRSSCSRRRLVCGRRRGGPWRLRSRSARPGRCVPASVASPSRGTGSCRTGWRCPCRRCPVPSRESARRGRLRLRPVMREGSMPSEPVSIDASSVRMSPNMFSVTTTSKSAGRSSRYIAIASTSRCSTSSCGNSSATTRVVTSRHRRDVSSTLALSTDVNRPLRSVARRHADLTTRSISPRV